MWKMCWMFYLLIFALVNNTIPQEEVQQHVNKKQLIGKGCFVLAYLTLFITFGTI
jgi:hypothetical protein